MLIIRVRSKATLLEDSVNMTRDQLQSHGSGSEIYAGVSHRERMFLVSCRHSLELQSEVLWRKEAGRTSWMLLRKGVY